MAALYKMQLPVYNSEEGFRCISALPMETDINSQAKAKAESTFTEVHGP